MSAAKSDLSSPKLDEEDEFDIIDQIRRCILWQPESDFPMACSCDQCHLKIARLMDFEKKIKAKKSLAENYLSQMNRKEELCLAICSCAEWARNMLYFLQHKLKAVYEELGIPWEHEEYARFKDVDEQITEKLIDCGLIGKPDDDDEYSEIPDSRTVLDYADTGDYLYSQTIVKNDACNIIKDIEKLEKDYNKDKQTAEASKICIEKQIKLVKDLPVENFLDEVEELIAFIQPRDKKFKKFHESRNCIYSTCAFIITKKKKYFQGAPSFGHHNSNKFDEILESLLDKVKSFEAKWNAEYANFFKPHDRSNPKRQAIG